MSENKLCFEKSLYLQQHAKNPIHWNAYGEGPLEEAKKLNKLIFMSIGYSSCHWCHVMAHESFEDNEMALFLNQHFISIKIDREEYPDLDHYYQKASSLMNGRGGWPLNVFLTPEGKPFFVGTYFPKSGRKGMPGFGEVIEQIQQTWEKDPEQFFESAKNLNFEITKPYKIEKKIDFKGHFPPPSAILNALKNYADTKNGGYGKAPKFPHFPFYEWTVEQILEGMIPQDQGQHIVETIEKMMMGGIYDHVKGGMHRYSVDEEFLVPHFEKMLYDQAGLLRVLSKLSQFYPAPIIFDGILQTLDYLKTEMISEENYFFSAQDADSEGVEGLYFTFSKEEFVASFEEAPPEQKIKMDHYLNWFRISPEGNFENALNVISLNPQFKDSFYTQEGWQEVRDIRRRLLEQRKLRMPPATDRKGIAGWNFMLQSALCDVVQYCPLPAIQQEAFEVLKQTIEGALHQFVKIDEDRRHVLIHTNTLNGQASYLEDYVQFADAQLRLYEVTGNEIFKKNSLESVDFVIKNFIQDGEVYMTTLNSPTKGIENLTASVFDQSYRSSVMTFVHLLSRVSLFKQEFSPTEILGKHYENLAQFVLNNPLGHGEGLRALSYPLEIYRKVEVPYEWIEHSEFRTMRTHFFSRFILDYHHRKDDSYQICTTTACEVSGKGFEDFQKLFTSKESNHA
jgi:uncharacterized protein YyaL (SSP411 family)